MNKFISSLLLLFALLLNFDSVQAAQCTNNEISNINVQQSSSNLIISGSSSETCTLMKMIVVCDKNKGYKSYTITPINGNWIFYVPYSDLNEIACCDKKVEILVSCYDGKDYVCTNTQTTNNTIECNQNETCPVIEINTDPILCSDRRSDGTWPVKFNISYHPGYFSEKIILLFGDYQSAELLPNQTSYIHYYNCPHSTPAYSVSATGIGCGMNNPTYTNIKIIPVDFPECDCPKVKNFIIDKIGCKVSLSVELDCENSVVEYLWDFGDGYRAQTQTNKSPIHLYNPGEYTVSVTLTGAGKLCVSSKDLQIDKCNNGDNDDNGDNGDSDCGFLGLKCIEFNICWILAVLLFFAVVGRLLLVAFGWGVNLNIADIFINITAADIASALVGAFAIIVFSICPCEAATMTLLAGIVSIIVILIILYYNAPAVPNWVMAITIATALIIASGIVLKVKDCI